MRAQNIKSFSPTPLMPLAHPLFKQHHLQVWLKREDLNHPTIQGNKWHKLKLNLLEAQQQNANTLITFGGAYSNHIAATAAAGKLFNFKTIGFIRGDELKASPNQWSHTLKTAVANGMTLQFLSRTDYRHKADTDFLARLQTQYPNSYIIPEGGTNALAIAGLASLAKDIKQQCPQWTHLLLPVGTGGTLAGLTKALNCQPHQKILGIPTAKNYAYLQDNINAFLPKEKHQTWSFLPQNYHFRYGKITPEIKGIIADFENQFNIPLDPVYTARMVLEFMTQVETNYFPPQANIILIHTGGLQGLVS